MPRISDMDSTPPKPGLYLPVLDTEENDNNRIALDGLFYVTPQMFGAVGDDATDDYAAFVAAIEYIKTLGETFTGDSTAYLAAPKLLVPFGRYYLSDTLDILDVTLHMQGEAAGSAQNGGNPVILRFAAGKTGIRIHYVNTTENTTRTSGIGAIGSVIENIKVTTDGSGGQTDADGFRLRAPCRLINCSANNFIRYGVNATAGLGAGGSSEGSTNQVHIIGGQYWNNGQDGIFFDGSDSSAGKVDGASCNSNGRWGYFDSSFLANAHFAVHSRTNGMVGSGPTYSPNTIGCMCSYSGQRYNVIPGQEAGASTNAPPGTAAASGSVNGASNTWWRWVSAGSTHPTIPAWVSGMTWQAGGAYRADGANARCVMVGGYTESDQGPAYISAVSLIVGGTQGAGVGSGAYIYGRNNMVHTETGFEASVDNGTGVSSTAQLGGGSEVGTYLLFSHSSLSQSYRIVYDATNGNLQHNYQNSASNAAYNITTPNTSWQFGRGAAVSHRMQVPTIFVGQTSSARGITSAAAAPATDSGTGDFVINNAPGNTFGTAGPFAWQCVVGGASPTYRALFSGFGITPIGYATGAGGTVTQATSKSTGVTLNKLSGQITMNNATLNASTSVGFTLTNSQIAANDTVSINIASGATAASYVVCIDAVAAGSCQIHLRNTSAGNLTEAVVLNFNVIKGVSS